MTISPTGSIRVYGIQLVRYFKYPGPNDPLAEVATSEEVTADPTETPAGYGFGIRHVQIFFMLNCVSLRIFSMMNMSIAIVSMTDRNSSNPDFHEFDWGLKEQSAILSSFSWGFIFTQVYAGHLGQLVSPKLLLFAGQLGAAVLTALTPAAAFLGGWHLVCALRTLQGFSLGLTLPLMYTLLSKWAPPSERNHFIGSVLSGSSWGASSVMPVCGFLASSSGGWPSIFYFTAAIGIIWCLLWLWLGADSPAVHPSISQKERDYIQNSLVHTSPRRNLDTPWLGLVKSIPFWALIATQAGNGVNLAIMTSEMPSYLNTVVGLNIKANGLLSSLPFMSMGIVSLLSAFLADYIKKKDILSDNVVRKLWTTIGQTGCSIALVVMSLLWYDTVATITLYVVSASLGAFLLSGFYSNHIDLAPNFSGVLMAISSGFESIAVIVAPFIVALVVHDSSSAEEWRIVFIISAATNILGNFVFILFGSTEVQAWNKVSDEETKKYSVNP